MYKQAITTTFQGPTNSRGSRIKATAEAGSITLSYDHGLSSAENHQAAAEALCKKLGWSGRLAGGGVKNGYVFVFV